MLLNLNGTWTGTLRSSHDDKATETPCTIVIRQTWTRLAIVLRTATSRSENLVAGVLINGADDALLVYEFQNERGNAAVPSMHPFHGHATLRLDRTGSNEILDGDYYAGRGRLTTGTMRVVRMN